MTEAGNGTTAMLPVTPERIVPVRLLAPGARLPQRAYEHDAAFDLVAVEETAIPPLRRAVVGTGVALDLPPDLCALTLPRSGLAAQHGVSLVNAPGLIDPGYRGEIRLILLNTDPDRTYTVHCGDRVAQLLFLPVTAVALRLAETLTPSARGERGFGSSGTGGEGER